MSPTGCGSFLEPRAKAERPKPDVGKGWGVAPPHKDIRPRDKVESSPSWERVRSLNPFLLCAPLRADAGFGTWGQGILDVIGLNFLLALLWVSHESGSELLAAGGMSPPGAAAAAWRSRPRRSAREQLPIYNPQGCLEKH